ncbi:harmonin-like isoform X2 [Argonauta hians]
MSDIDLALRKNFETKVGKLIPKDEEEVVFTALRKYQSSLDLPTFITDLKSVLNEPDRVVLFEDIRPLVPLNQQLVYDCLSPIIPSSVRKVILLQNTDNGSLGFSIRGGAEYKTGMFVSDVSTTSEAYRKDLRCGDQIISINGFNIFEAVHAEVIDLINALVEIELKVKRIGMIPFRTHASDVVRWEYVPKEKIVPNMLTYPTKIFINMSSSGGLGCRIVSDPPKQKGIFVQHVKPDSLAQDAGLEPGDQILSVNNTSFLDVTHSQAVIALKNSHHLLLRIRKQVGVASINSLKTRRLSSNPAPSRLTSPDRPPSPIYAEVKKRSDRENIPSASANEEKSGMLNGYHDNKSPYEKDVGYSEIEVRHEDDLESSPYSNHDNPDPPVDSNFIMYKNPELSISNENIGTLSENEARNLFTAKEIGGRQIRTIKINVKGPLGLSLEGGDNSPLEGRILVSNILTGCIYQQGGIHVGDEILMADNSKFIGLKLTEAEKILKKAEGKAQKTIEFIIAVAPPRNYEEEITYF